MWFFKTQFWNDMEQYWLWNMYFCGFKGSANGCGAAPPGKSPDRR